MHPDQGQHFAQAAEDEEGRDDMDAPPVARPKEIKLKDVYEPSEIAEKMLTEEDEMIRVRDVPERFQVCRLRLS